MAGSSWWALGNPDPSPKGLFEEVSPEREWEIGISTAIAGEQQVDA
jgi:hypothetical protein